MGDAQQSIKGHSPVQQQGNKKLEGCTLGSMTSHTLQLGTGMQKSPTKSPVKGRRQLPALLVDTAGQLDDVDDAPDSVHANDQKEQRVFAIPQQQQPLSTEVCADVPKDGAPHKYIQLLNIASNAGLIHGKAKLVSSPAAAATSVRQQANTASTAALTGAGPTLLRSSIPASSSSVAAKTTPINRASRSRASILDSSPGASLIPPSPATATASSERAHLGSRVTGSGLSSTALQASPGKRPELRTGNKALEAAVSPARRSLGTTGAAATGARPQYAFGSRIDPAAARKPSPMRQSAPSPVRQRGVVGTVTQAAAPRNSASPQRVPAVARSAGAAATGPLRSASAPRMASAEKVQTRFAQHQANAAAAQRSKTPNPAARAGGSSPAGPVGSSPPSAASRAKVLVASTGHTPQSRHIARMRGSDIITNKLPGSSIRSPASPVSKTSALRSSTESLGANPSASKSVNRMPSAAAGSPGSRPGVAGSTGSPTKPKAVASPGQRTAVPHVERTPGPGSTALVGSSSKSLAASNSIMGIPTLQDRYRSGYKHTPAAIAVAEARAAAAAIAVAEARAAAAATTASPAATSSKGSSPPVAVPKLSLGALLKSPATPELLRTREIEDNSSISAALPDIAGAGCDDSSSAASPFLGRISAVTPAGIAPISAHKQQQSRLLPLHTSADVAIPGTPISPSAAMSTPVQQSSSFMTPSAERVRCETAALGESMSPPLLPREVSGGSIAPDASISRQASREFRRQSSTQTPGLSMEGSSTSVDSASVAVAAKGLVLPLHRLQEEAAHEQFSSPPRHRRGEGSSPKGAAAICSQLLKSKVNSVCSSVKPAKPDEAAACAAETPAALQAVDAADETAADREDGKTPGYATPAAHSISKTLDFSPGESKLRGLVPRLDLTPVLAQVEQEQLEDQEAHDHDHLQQDAERAETGQLLLEHHPIDDQQEQEQLSRRRTRAGGQEGRPESAGTAVAKRGAGSVRRPSSGSSKRSSAPAEPPPQESFYVYESVMPAEETRTYDELRRALLKCHNGHKLAASLQGIWGCYQDARRNTEAMAFRGHRLLDQVSNEYCAYKREAEQQLQHLEQERDAYKEDLQLALSGAPMGNRDVEIARKDKQVRELQQENQQLRLQMVEMEKALQKAADYHHAQQADQVPTKARTIAESATTSILFQQNVAQREELLKSQKMLDDMKAALMIACGALKHTNYMDPEGPVRAGLAQDTVQVLDMMISSTQAEASMLDETVPTDHSVPSHVEIEELH